MATIRLPRTLTVGATVAGVGDRCWGPVSGRVTEQRAVWLGRAPLSTGVTIVGLVGPLLVGFETGAPGMRYVAIGIGVLVAVVALPVAFVLILLSLGQGGPFAFLRRAVGGSLLLWLGVSQRRRLRGTPDRCLVISSAGGQSRVAVALALDIPTGSMVTAYGPRFGGYLHAWLIRTHGLDARPLPARGVRCAFAALGVGSILLVLSGISLLVPLLAGLR